jgi:hypothetical protein
VDQLGPNALGEVLEPGRVADCYLGLLLPPLPAGELEAGTVLVVAPAALLHPRVPQPEGSLIYELLTGHPEREAGELVFVADLTGELRAWPHDTWARLGVDPDQVAQAVIGCWQDGEVSGLQVDDLDFEQAPSLTRPADPVPDRGGPDCRRRPRPDGTGASRVVVALVCAGSARHREAADLGGHERSRRVRRTRRSPCLHAPDLGR